MKILIRLLFISFVIALGACNKEDEIHNTDTKVGISRVTFFPLISLKGDDLMTVPKGGTFTDPGVDATEGGATIPYTTSPTVNTAVPGVYSVIYTATNKDGFSASVLRRVCVYETETAAAAQDLSGTYARTSNGEPSTWTKLAPGVYKVFNPGGAPGTNVTVIAINPTVAVVKIPTQLTGVGSTPFGSTNETYFPTAVPPKYSWQIVNSGYGTALRTFVKQ